MKRVASNTRWHYEVSGVRACDATRVSLRGRNQNTISREGGAALAVHHFDAPVRLLVGLCDPGFGRSDFFLLPEDGDLRVMSEIGLKRTRIQTNGIEGGLASGRVLGT